MAITFEEVSADIQRDPAREAPTTPPAAPAAAGGETLRASLETELRLLAERSARLSAD